MRTLPIINETPEISCCFRFNDCIMQTPICVDTNLKGREYMRETVSLAKVNLFYVWEE